MKRNRLLANGLMRLAAYALMALVGVGAGEAWGEIGIAPRVNPQHHKWLEEKDTIPSSNSEQRRVRALLRSRNGEETSLTAMSNGLEPSIIDYGYLNLINSTSVSGVGDKLDPTFDPRKNFKMPPVRNQDPQGTGIGTCWAQASVGSMEMWLAKHDIQKQFSVKNMVNLEGWDSNSWFGGNFDRAAAYLFRWDGPVLESSDPYTDEEGILKYSQKSLRFSPVYHAQQSRIVKARTGPLDNEGLKRAIIQFGGLYAAYGAYSDSEFWNAEKGAYFVSESAKERFKLKFTHAVTLVGWDDTYKRTNFNTAYGEPAGDGAFIIKDSYGTDKPRDNGYIYVSYYDAMFAYIPSCAFPMLESVENYSSIYQYDELGHVTDYGFSAGKNSNGDEMFYISGYGANLFKAVKDETLAAVGFYATAPSTEYTICIFTGCSANKPTSGNVKITQEGVTDTYAGYYTIVLKNEVSIRRDELFSVVVWIKTPGYGGPLAYEASGYWYKENGTKTYCICASDATAAKGQSFLSADGTTWSDFTELVDPTANFCCKAYTKSGTPPKSQLSSIRIEVPEGVSKTVKRGDKIQLKCIAKYSNNRDEDVTEKASWSFTAGRDYATLSKGLLEVKKDIVIKTDSRIGIKASYKEGSISPTDAKIEFELVESAPDAPTGITATEGTATDEVKVNWKAANRAATYAVYRSKTSSVNNKEHLPPDVTTTEFHDTTATPGVDYWYFVNAKNSSGSSMNNVGVKGWRKLLPPEVEATKNLSDKVEVKWEASAGAKAYRVYRSDTLDGAKNPLSGWQTETKYSDKTAAAGRTYYYYVKAAINTNGDRPSDYSIVEDGMIVPPVTVSKLTISGAATIESGKSAEYTASVEYSDQSNPKDVTASCNWSKLGSAADWNGSTKTLTAKTVTSDQKVKLIAFYTENKTTIVCTNEVTITPGTSPLTAPSGLKVTSQTTTGIGLSWNAVTGAGSYNVYRAANGETAEKIGSKDTTSFTDNTATPGVTYTYSVSAANSKGESARSGTVTGTVPLSAPTSVTATSDRTDGVNISWQPSAGATYYRVARATSKTGTKTELGTWTTNKSYLDTSATAGTTYYYFVRAATSSGGANASGYSDPAAQGMRIPSLGSLSSISIEGQGNVSSGQVALYTCAALYSNGESHTVKADTWSASPTTAATIDGNGKLTAKNVTKDTDVTVSVSYTEGDVTKSATKTVKILASTSQAQVKDVTITSRWPFAAILDIDYTLLVNSSGGKASVRVFGRDEDRGVDVAAKTLSGDGSDGSAIAAGTHRLSWDVGTDYPDYHGNAFGVTLSATPYVAQTCTVTYSPGTYGTGAQKTATKTENVTLTLLGAAFTRTGYTQTGWATSDGGAKVYDLSASYTANASITLYPFWTRSYNLMPLRNLLTNIEKLNPDGVLSDDELNKAMNNPHYADLDGNADAISSAEMSIFTRIQALNTDKTLLSNVMKGDYTGIPDATMDELQSLSDAVKELTSNRTLTVTYMPGANGTGSQQTDTKTKDVALTLKGAIFTRTGYTQTGWATSDGGAKAYDLGASYTANASITLYPFWTAKSYTLTVNPNGGTLVGSNFGASNGTSQQVAVSVTYGALYYYELGTATLSGYTFDGWWTSATGGEQVYTANGLAVTGSRYWNSDWQWQYDSNVTIYAHWKSDVSLAITMTGSYYLGKDGWLISGNSYTVRCIATFANGTTQEVEAYWSVLSGQECISNLSRFTSIVIQETPKGLVINSGMAMKGIKIQAKYTYNGRTYTSPEMSYTIWQ